MHSRLTTVALGACILAFLAVPGAISQTSNTPTLPIKWYDQPASGARVVGLMSNPSSGIGYVTQVKNFSTQTIIGLRLIWTMGPDKRLDPETKAKPETLKESPLLSEELAPGQTLDLRDMALPIADLFAKSQALSTAPPVLRIGVAEVDYGNGMKQTFDLLHSEQATRSRPVADLGGVDRKSLPSLFKQATQ